MQQLRNAWLEVEPLSFHTLTKNEIMGDVPMLTLDERLNPLAQWLLAMGNAYQEIAPVECRELQGRVKMLYLSKKEPLLSPFDRSEEIFRLGVFFAAYGVHFFDSLEDKPLADTLVCSVEQLEKSLMEGAIDAKIKDHLFLIAKLYSEFLNCVCK